MKTTKFATRLLSVMLAVMVGVSNLSLSAIAETVDATSEPVVSTEEAPAESSEIETEDEASSEVEDAQEPSEDESSEESSDESSDASEVEESSDVSNAETEVSEEPSENEESEESSEVIEKTEEVKEIQNNSNYTGDTFDNFFTSVEIGSGLNSDGSVIPFGDNVDRNANVSMVLNYTIPMGTVLEANKAYTFTIDAPLIVSKDTYISVVASNGAMAGQQIAYVKFSDGTDGGINANITFNDDAIKNGYGGMLTADVPGGFNFTAKFNGSKMENLGANKVNIKINDTCEVGPLTINFALPSGSTNINLTKSAGVVDLNNDTITWTLEATPSTSGYDDEYAHVSGIKIVDNTSDSNIILPDNFNVDAKLKSTNKSINGTLTVADDGNSFTWETADGVTVDSGDTIILTYQTTFDTTKFKSGSDGKVYITNKAEATAAAPEYTKDPDTGLPTVDYPGYTSWSPKSSSSATTPITCATLDKAGYLLNGGSIQWTVTATNSLLRENPHVTDTLPKTLEIDESAGITLKIYSEDGSRVEATIPLSSGTSYPAYSITKASSTDGQDKITFYLAEGTKGKQEITYSTKLKDGVSSVDADYVNSVEFYGGPGVGIGYSKTAAKVNPSTTILSKSGAYNSTDHTITWTAKIKAEGYNLGDTLTVSDVLGQTPVAQTFVDGSLTLVDSSNTALENTLTVAEDKTSFTLEFNNTNSVYTIKYKTLLDDNAVNYWGNNNSWTESNTISLKAPNLTYTTSVTGYANCTSKMIQKSSKGYNYVDNTMSWQVSVNRNGMELGDASTGKGITLTDTLSNSDWSYDTDSVVVKKNGTVVAIDASDIVVTKDDSGIETMTITLPYTEKATKSGWVYTVDYNTTLVNKEVLKSNEKFSVTNNVNVVAPQTPTSGVGAKANQSAGQSVLDKSGITDNYNLKITWTIDVNKNLADLSSIDSIYDKLQDGLLYKGVTVKKLEYVNNTLTEGDDLVEDVDYTATFDADSRLLTIKWLGENALKNQAYRVTLTTITSKSGSYSNTVNFSAKEAEKQWETSTSQNQSVSYNSGWTKIPEGYGSLKLLKKDTNGNLLGGATFTIDGTQVESNSKEAKNVGVLTVEIDKYNYWNGYSIALPAGTYVITEVTSPDGYAKTSSTQTVTVNTATDWNSPTEVTFTNKKMNDTSKGALTITKTIEGSVTENELKGDLTFTVTNNDTNESTEYTLDKFTNNNGVYTLSLEETPGGYTVKETVKDSITGKKFVKSTVAVNGGDATETNSADVTLSAATETTVDFTNEYQNVFDVEISKQTVGGEELAGATLTVTDEDNNEVVSWTSSADETKTITVPAGTYTLTENAAPAGYDKTTSITFVVDANGTVTVNGEDVNGKVVMTDELTIRDVEISKQTVGGVELEGAQLTVTNADNETVDSWTSGTTSHTVQVPMGTYTLTENAAPAGYDKTTSITLVVDANGTVTVDGEDVNGKVVMTDELTIRDVEISKQTVGGEELEGAQLTVTNANNETVDSWTSGAEAHTVQVPMGTYTLTENAAPAGYDKTTSITFVVDANGTVTVDGEDVNGKVVMTDELTIRDVEISKQTVGGEELEGAQLTVTNANNETVDSWTSGTTSHTVQVPMGTYTLTENTAPLGYDKATAIEFVVDANGKVTVDGEEVTKVTMVDELTERTVKVSKQTVGGEELADAQLTIYKANEDGVATSEVVDSWTSTTEVHEATLTMGNYVLHENAAPAGYNLTTDIAFTVDGNGVVTVDGKDVNGTVTMTDELTVYNYLVSKQTVGGEELAGAKLEVYSTKDGETYTADDLVESWTSTNESHEISLTMGTYILHEDAAPAGYDVTNDVTFVVAPNGEVTVDGDKVTSITMVDDLTIRDVDISKVDVYGDELPDAVLTVYEASQGADELIKGDIVDTWTSDGTAHTISVPMGTYILSENAAPAGYDVATDITFTVDEYGVVTSTSVDVVSKEEDGNYVVTMLDELTEFDVELSKVDVGGDELAGAELTISYAIDEDNGHVAGDQLYSWTSGDDGVNEDGTVKTHTVKLTMGAYILHENAAPAGYDVATDIVFGVDQYGNVVNVDESSRDDEGDDYKSNVVDGKKVVMTDDYTIRDVEISKQTVGGEELEGAQLTLYIADENGVYTQDDAIYTWTSGEDGVNEDGTVKTHTVSVPMGTYVLHENAAPAGYDVATEITFVVDENGVVTVNGEDVNGKVTMTDELTVREVWFSKSDVAGDELEGAELTITDENGETVASWTSGTEKTLVQLTMGTYTLHENAAPAGYDVATDITFTVAPDGTVSSDAENVVAQSNGDYVVTMIDEVTLFDVEISKVDATTSKEIEGAKLVIKNENGEEVASWTSGSDGKNSDGTFKTHTVQLPFGTYTLTEITAPNGYEVAETITFTVGKDGKVEGGKVVMKDAPIVTPTATPTATPDATTPKTGDDSNVGMWIMLLAFSACAVLVIAFIGKRKHQK